jgi:hypothetical protein
MVKAIDSLIELALYVTDFMSRRINIYYEYNSLRVDMSLHSDTLFWFRANQSLLFLLNDACLSEKQQLLIL